MCISSVHLKFRQFSSPYKGWGRYTKYAWPKKYLLDLRSYCIRKRMHHHSLNFTSSGFNHFTPSRYPSLRHTQSICFLGMIAATGICTLQHADLTSTRNMFIIGFTFMFGLSFPKWLSNNPGTIQTGKVQSASR